MHTLLKLKVNMFYMHIFSEPHSLCKAVCGIPILYVNRKNMNGWKDVDLLKKYECKILGIRFCKECLKLSL